MLDFGEEDAVSAAWSPDGTSIATAHGDGSVHVFDARSGRERFVLLGHRGRVKSVDWSHDSTRIVTASDDGTAKVWRVGEAGGRELFTLSAQATRAGIASAAVSPDGSRIVTGDVESRAAIVWDASIAGDGELANVPAVGRVALTPDGRYLVAGNATGGVSVWDAQTFRSVRTLGAPDSTSSDPSPSGAPVDPPVSTGVEVTALDVSPDGRLVAAAITDWTKTPVSGSSLRIWDIETGQEAFRIRPRGGVDDVAWSPDSALLAVSASIAAMDANGEVASLTGSLAVVDRSGEEVAFLSEEEWVQILSIAFTSDGERIIGSRSPMASWLDYFGQAAIWNWRTGQVERSIDTGNEYAVLSPRADLLVSTPRNVVETGSQVAEVWDWATGRHLGTLSHSGSVTHAAFSPDGSRLATASLDGTVRIWDPYADAPEQLVLRGHTGDVDAVSWSPDGTRLASASCDGTVRVWALDLDELVDAAERGLTRTLTDDECRQYLHAEQCP